MSANDDLDRRLRSVLGDRLLTRRDAAFAATAELALAGDGRTPATIARPIDATEVAAVVRAAAESGAPLAIRAGGHSYARLGTVADGIVLDLRLLDGVRIDAPARVGYAGGGATAGAYTTAAAAHGLATGFGDTGTVGIGGLALGGGIGFLSRRDGLTIDNVLAVEAVLADGRVVRADAEHEPDLFWALRGGGGGTAVATRFELRLAPVPVVTGGALAFEPRPETVVALLEALADAPDELSAIVNVMTAPPAPFLPAERHGTPIVVALVCHAGDPERAEAAIAPLRAAGTALAGLVRAQPYPALFRAEEPGLQADIRTGFADGFAVDRAALAIELVRTAPSELAVVSSRPMGGAIARTAPDATAFAHRGAAIMQSLVAVDPPDRGPDRGRAWVAEAGAALGIGEGAGYVNFLADAGDEAARRAYPGPTLERLRSIRRAYDPEGVLRRMA
jgi:FAD/FMN-containing dehydrogenase